MCFILTQLDNGVFIRYLIAQKAMHKKLAYITK